MRLESLTEPDVAVFDTLVIGHHNATHPEKITQGGSFDAWVFRVVLAPHRVRARRQEDEVLRHFARAQQVKGG